MVARDQRARPSDRVSQSPLRRFRGGPGSPRRIRQLSSVLVSGLTTTIYCKVCGLPDRKGVARCEACEHELGTALDWDALRARLPGLRKKILWGLFVLAGFVVGSCAAWGGGGYVIAIGPIGWIVWHGYQYRLISARLRVAERGEGGSA